MVAVAIMVSIVVPVSVIVVAVAIMVSMMVPVSVIVIIVVISVIMVAMTPGRVGLVEVVSGIEAATSMAMATPEGHEHCGTMVEHPSDTVAGVDAESPATGAP